ADILVNTQLFGQLMTRLNSFAFLLSTDQFHW
ncbi:hypothetical protein AAULR_11795, partial [Lacticaseibacillus rhamnosus MTCC 5462]